MKTTINYFSRMLCVFLLSAGVVLTSCEETDPIDDNTALSLGEVTFYSATFTGHLNVPASEVPFTQVTLLYSDAETFNVVTATSISITSFDAEQNFTVTLTDLKCLTKYNYCLYVKEKSAEETYGEIQSFTTLQHPYLTEEALDVSAATDLSSTESANCYIVSETGLYKFKAVKGNSNESVGNVATADVLWETFGSDVTPIAGDLISGVCHKDGYIAFEVNKTFKEGNAVIHAKDAEGNIIWSWHIWMTDKPQEQVYFNDAGTMMDRNLGATSATPGDVGALGLLYQWGRKDPFLSSSSISEAVEAKSTITWSWSVFEYIKDGSMEDAISHPTTTILSDNSYRWMQGYLLDLWPSSDKDKSIYDPCPAGWRVPDGGENGVWAKASGLFETLTEKEIGFEYELDKTNNGWDFSNTFGSASNIWYPCASFRSNFNAGELYYGIKDKAYYWTAHNPSVSTPTPYCMTRNSYSNVCYIVQRHNVRKDVGASVRCIKE